MFKSGLFMNKKNLIIFALILIAFTIGAASASQDINNLTVDEGVDETSMDIEEEQLESSVEDETDGLNSLKEENLISSFEDNDKLEGDDFEIHVADKIDFNDRDQVIFSIKCPEGATGAFYVSFGTYDSSQTIPYYISEDNWGTVMNWTINDFNLLSAGKYHFFVQYNSQTVIDEDVKIVDPNLVITGDDFEVNVNEEVILGSDNEVVFNLTAPQSVYGNIIITVGDREIQRYVDIRQNVLIYNLEELGMAEYGTYNLKFKFVPEDEGEEIDLGSYDVFVTFLFKIYAAYFDGESWTDYHDLIDFKQNVTVKVVLPEDYNGDLRVWYGNQEKTLDESLTFKINSNDLKVGYTDLKARLTEDSKYPDREINNPLDVKPIFYFINEGNGDTNTNDVSEFDEVYLVMEATNGTSGKLYLYNAIEDNYRYVPQELLASCEVNGTTKLQVPLNGLKGTVLLFAKFEDNEGYVHTSQYDYLNLQIFENSKELDVSINPATFVEGKSTNIVFTLSENCAPSYDIYIDGEKAVNGYLTYEKPTIKTLGNTLAPGVHKVYVQVKGVLQYSKMFYITVLSNGDSNNQNGSDVDGESTYPKIIAYDLKVLYSAKQKYSVKVYDKNGKLAKNAKVTFQINGKTVATVRTDKNGVASFTVTQKPKTYKITVSALGKSVTKTLTAKHVLKLKKVKIRKSASKVVLKAKLKKVNGKYLKGKKITFKIKGKKYKAKTNKKGLAKVTVKKSLINKLNVGKKVTVKAIYKKDIVKKSVKVKR